MQKYEGFELVTGDNADLAANHFTDWLKPLLYRKWNSTTNECHKEHIFFMKLEWNVITTFTLNN